MQTPRVAVREWAARDAVCWLLVVAAGLLVTAVAVGAAAKVGVTGAPFTGEYRFKVEVGTLLAPLVAVLVLAGVRTGLADRLSWRGVLVTAYVANALWAVSLALVDGGNGLAGPVSGLEEYAADIAAVDAGPVRFVETFVDRAEEYSVATRTHPPAPTVLLWVLRSAGVVRPLTLGLVLTLLGCLAVPCAAIAVRSVLGERAARRLLPALVLAPYAVWVAVSMDGVVAALTAAFVAAGVVASEPGRRPHWPIAAGALLGLATLFSYSAGWLGVIPLLVCYQRRRGTTIALLGLGALIPIGIARVMGFVWPDGLTAAQEDWSLRIGPHRSWLLWAFLDLVLLVIACGPLIVTAARRLSRTPAWPFVIGALLGVGFAVGSGLSRGEVERSWLPFFPWLLVPVVAPRGGDDGVAPSPLLLAVGAAAAIVIESVLRSAW